MAGNNYRNRGNVSPETRQKGISRVFGVKNKIGVKFLGGKKNMKMRRKYVNEAK